MLKAQSIIKKIQTSKENIKTYREKAVGDIALWLVEDQPQR